MRKFDVWAVVPVKKFQHSKTRLSNVLHSRERRLLCDAMLRDVLASLSGCAGLAGILVVTGDDDVIDIAREYGARTIFSPIENGPSVAIAMAAKLLAEEGATGMLAVMGDLPLISRKEIEHLLLVHASSPAVTLVPSQNGLGTNAVLCSPPNFVQFRFDGRSFLHNRSIATRYGATVRIEQLDGLSLDIDTSDNLTLFLEYHSTTKTAKYLRAGPARTMRKLSPINSRGGVMNYFGKTPFVEATDQRLPIGQAFKLVDVYGEGLNSMLQAASNIRDQGHGDVITYSKNVFIPLTHLCRNVCHYCIFAEVPDRHTPAFMSREEVLTIARRAAQAGCTEALLTLGDKPELRYAQARRELAALGHETTISYLIEISELVMRETGLLPHVNPGVLDDTQTKSLRRVSASQGIMLESSSDRLCERGGPHHGSPDKRPAVRLETVRLAGENKVPFTSGLLIGIGETRIERIDSLIALRNLHDQYDHIQEIIIQNFKPKPGTRMSNHPEPDFEELLWTIAMTRLLFGPKMNIQAPPNLLGVDLSRVIAAGINDWGGVSPVTPDFVNPEAPWPNVETLSKRTCEGGKLLCQRLAVYPDYALDAREWLSESVTGAMLKHCDSVGLARAGSWFAGGPSEDVTNDEDLSAPSLIENERLDNILDDAMKGRSLNHEETIRLLTARGAEAEKVRQAADVLRTDSCGDDVTYVVNCNINYTNICTFRCAFCAFSKGRIKDESREKPYLREIDEIVAMAAEAAAKGATEVCLQGGIHPSYNGETYLGIAQAIHESFPSLHIHAFSPLEVWHGAQTIGSTIEDYLRRLKDVGLKSLPGTAAEILDDEIRALICPDKLTTDLWLKIVETAHNIGIPTTATIMFGHVEQPRHVANHLIHIRDLQTRTGGFTEFVPLPFVHMEAPISLKNRSRRGPTFREAVLMHATARLVLHPHITNIQTSWVKMGLNGAKSCLNAGANDLGGTLMHESISRAAGAVHGQEFDDRQMRAFINSINRRPRQRTTDYGRPVAETCCGND